MKPAMSLLNLIKANLPVAVGHEKLPGKKEKKKPFDNGTFYFSGMRGDHPPVVYLSLLMGAEVPV